MTRKESEFAMLATNFIIAIGLFKSTDFTGEGPCYTPLANPSNDIRGAMKQLHYTDPEFAYPILMDYIRLAVYYLLFGHKPPKLEDIAYDMNKHVILEFFLALPNGKDIEVYDVAEVLDDLVLYSAQLGAEYLRLINIIAEHIDAAFKKDDKSWDFEHKVWHNFCVLKDYARRLILSRWYRVYLENIFPNPALTRIREDSFNYINSLCTDAFLKEYIDIKKCVNEHPDFFYDNGCL